MWFPSSEVMKRVQNSAILIPVVAMRNISDMVGCFVGIFKAILKEI